MYCEVKMFNQLPGIEVVESIASTMLYSALPSYEVMNAHILLRVIVSGFELVYSSVWVRGRYLGTRL